MPNPPAVPLRDDTFPVPAVETPPTRPARVHLGHVDGLRALAALFVVCVHYLPMTWAGTIPSNPVFRVLAKVLSGGHFAVSMFIVISGFCLMLPALRDDLTVKGGFRRFLPRRFFRIAPPLYCALLLSLVLLPFSLNPDTHQPFALSDGLSLRVVIGHLLMVHHITGLVPNNGVFWSVGIEWWIYFWFLPLLWVWRRFGGLTACALTLLGSFGLAAVNDYVRPVPGLLFPQYLGLFAVGAGAAYIASGADLRLTALRRHPFWLPASAMASLCLIALVTKMGWERAYRHISLLDSFIAIAVPALLIACQQERHAWLRRLLAAKPLAFVGVFSYSLYLTHLALACAFLLPLLMHLNAMQQTARFVVCVGFILGAICFGWVFYRLCEAPFHKIARKF